MELGRGAVGQLWGHEMGHGPRGWCARGGGKGWGLGCCCCRVGLKEKGDGPNERKSFFLFIQKGLNQNFQHLYKPKFDL